MGTPNRIGIIGEPKINTSETRDDENTLGTLGVNGGSGVAALPKAAPKLSAPTRTASVSPAPRSAPAIPADNFVPPPPQPGPEAIPDGTTPPQPGPATTPADGAAAPAAPVPEEKKAPDKHQLPVINPPDYQAHAKAQGMLTDGGPLGLRGPVVDLLFMRQGETYGDQDIRETFHIWLKAKASSLETTGLTLPAGVIESLRTDSAEGILFLTKALVLFDTYLNTTQAAKKKGEKPRSPAIENLVDAVVKSGDIATFEDILFVRGVKRGQFTERINAIRKLVEERTSAATTATTPKEKKALEALGTKIETKTRELIDGTGQGRNQVRGVQEADNLGRMNPYVRLARTDAEYVKKYAAEMETGLAAAADKLNAIEDKTEWTAAKVLNAIQGDVAEAKRVLIDGLRNQDLQTLTALQAKYAKWRKEGTKEHNFVAGTKVESVFGTAYDDYFGKFYARLVLGLPFDDEEMFGMMLVASTIVKHARAGGSKKDVGTIIKAKEAALLLTPLDCRFDFYYQGNNSAEASANPDTVTPISHRIALGFGILDLDRRDGWYGPHMGDNWRYGGDITRGGLDNLGVGFQLRDEGFVGMFKWSAWAAFEFLSDPNLTYDPKATLDAPVESGNSDFNGNLVLQLTPAEEIALISAAHFQYIWGDSPDILRGTLAFRVALAMLGNVAKPTKEGFFGADLSYVHSFLENGAYDNGVHADLAYQSFADRSWGGLRVRAGVSYASNVANILQGTIGTAEDGLSHPPGSGDPVGPKTILSDVDAVEFLAGAAWTTPWNALTAALRAGVGCYQMVENPISGERSGEMLCDPIVTGSMTLKF
ncbi:MAG: hypothetical protein HYV02_05845 [Deltaproteobacteria bacterium]|nr:hypothetical protein [Deltaproteobacteria bacterium]